jgi:hypothetical protein
MEQRERPSSTSQQATVPGRPHVELNAHNTIPIRHRFGMRSWCAAIFACLATHLT